MRNIIHLHIPSFQITLERVNRLELRDRPVVVAPAHSERALILSVSREARREGIFKGMALNKALRFCPDLTVLPPNPGLMEKGTQALTEAVAHYTPLWEPAQPGHMYMDVTGTERLWGRAKDAARRIGKEMKDRLSLPGAVGVAGNKMVSGIASRLMATEGVLDVDHGRESAFMAPLKVDFLPGIGHVRKRVLLEELHITLVREIAVLDMQHLKMVFGMQALMIHQRAWGIDPTPVHPPERKPMVSESITLARDENDDYKLLATLYAMVEKCGQRLRSRSLVPRHAGLLIRYSDQMEVARQVKLNGATFYDMDLYAPLEMIFYKAYQRRVGIRFMRVWFRDLIVPSPQLSLFSRTPAYDGKKAPVTNALDRIRERYGEKAIKYGRAV
ncbi:MAG: DNA polymerase IV [Deltaproteobacteria bacterium]|nr:DNA polymerase IV [Deltaproteobacteria bacterium]